MRWADKAICAIGTQILAALHYIHGLGIIHRDVTLKNIIWFNGGIFKLCNFGISKQNVLPDEYARTFIGHKSYIPPELFHLGYSTHQSDIYQLGLVLLTLIKGQHPIPENATPEQTRSLILDGVPRQIADPLIPTHGRVAQIISIMLRRRKEYRYKSAADAWADCEQEFRRQEGIERIITSLPGPRGITLPPWLKNTPQRR
jgi:serine/threonine-protein kinase